MPAKIRSTNLLFQSEQHPLVSAEFNNRESFVLSLIHRKAYSRASRMAEGLLVLDLGCNNGYGTRAIAERARHVIGVDVSRKAIGTAMVRHSAPNIEYRIVEGEGLPFENESFDFVASFQVIEHVDEVGRYLAEVRRVLRGNGRAVFTTPNRCIRLEPGQKPWNPFHVREYEAAELDEALRSVFPKVEIEGLFAAPEIYQIEYDRAEKAKRAGQKSKVQLRLNSMRVRSRTAAIKSVKSLLPEGVVRRLRSTMSTEPVETPDNSNNSIERMQLSEFMQRWSLDDLYYEKQNLQKALDLFAVCAV